MLMEVLRFFVKQLLFETTLFCGLPVMNSSAATMFCNRPYYIDKYEMTGSWFEILVYSLKSQNFLI